MSVLLQHAADLVCIAHKCITRTPDSLLKLLIWKSGRLRAKKMDPYHVGDVSVGERGAANSPGRNIRGVMCRTVLKKEDDNYWFSFCCLLCAAI